MSRSLSIAGLPREFKKFQEDRKLKVVGQLPFKELFYSDGYAMKIYEDENKNRYEEFECGQPWRSGPELFLGLRDSNGNILFSWTKSQMGFEEDVILDGYDYDQKAVFDLFIKEENEERCKGYCGLAVLVEENEVILWQTQSRNHYAKTEYTIPLLKPEDGAKIRDWLYQQGFSVEEMYE